MNTKHFILLGFISFISLSLSAETYIVNAARAHFHNSPNTTSKRNAYVILGDKVDLLESKTGWAKVIYRASNTEGWIRSELLSIKKLSKVQCYRAYFHNLPNAGTRRKAYVIENDNVQILEELDTWKRVIFYGKKQNTVGWIQDDCLGVTNISNLIETLNDYSKSTNDRPKVYAVIVGIAEYSVAQNNRGADNLEYSDDDAYKIYAFLKSSNGGKLPSDQIKLLINKEATLKNVLNESRNLFNQARPQDLVLFYFSGHGSMNTFVGHDKNISHTEIKEILKNSKAQKKLCIADACHSGSLANTPNKTKSKGELIDDYYAALAKSSDGIALFLSSKANELSIEATDFGQGIFTYYYIEGLKGYADENNDNIVTIQELYNYTKENVEDYSRESGSLQRPQLKGTFDHDMPVGVTN